MLRVSACMAAALFVLGLFIPATAQARDYYEWSTRQPFQGWVWGGRRSCYCSYIKYPVRDCRTRDICRRGRCRTEEKCRVVGWDIRESCY